MNDLTVEEARARMLALAVALPSERVPLEAAFGRVLAETVTAGRDQPPFNASAMDGWAVAGPGTAFRIVGESAAGHAYAPRLNPGEAVRIFTGAPVPTGADRVVIQEEAKADGERLTTPPADDRGSYIRPAGGDFKAGQTLLERGVRLDAWRIGLAAAAGRDALDVARAIEVVLVSTGEEIVPPGGRPGPDQIFDSGGPTLARLIARWGGAEPRLLRAGDDAAAIARAVADAGGDVVVTLGGASVGDHDLVKKALDAEGVAMAFWKIAMRPGKPMMHGRLGSMRVIGVPGNPVSSYVCTLLFVVPLIRALLGNTIIHHHRDSALLGRDLAPNDVREDYLRAIIEERADGTLVASPVTAQDSSLLANLSRSQGLVIRAPFAPAAKAGSPCEILRLPE